MSKAVLTEYELRASGLTLPLKVALVADLHERPADDILKLLQNAKPDLLAIAGDTLERCGENGSDASQTPYPLGKRIILSAAHSVNHALRLVFAGNNHPDKENAYRFLRGTSELCPVFMSLGNHENVLTGEDYRILASLGVHLLDNADYSLDIGGQMIRAGGLSSRYDRRWLERFSRKDGYKILLCHHPEYYDTLLDGANFDLVLAGHNHGGQVRLFGRGLMSSTTGPLPKYDKGVFDGRMVVSAGCSNTTAIPRFNNPREAVIIRLTPTE